MESTTNGRAARLNCVFSTVAPLLVRIGDGITRESEHTSWAAQRREHVRAKLRQADTRGLPLHLLNPPFGCGILDAFREG